MSSPGNSFITFREGALPNSKPSLKIGLVNKAGCFDIKASSILAQLIVFFLGMKLVFYLVKRGWPTAVNSVCVGKSISKENSKLRQTLIYGEDIP